MPTITLENVTKNYKLDRRQQKEHKGKRFEVGVQDIDLTIKQGEFVFLIGSSGAGKSTLLDLISGRLKPDKGTVCLDKKDLSKLIPGAKTARPSSSAGYSRSTASSAR